MRLSAIILTTLAALTLTLYSCNDTSEVGSSIVQDQVEVVIDSTFTLTGHSVANSAIQSKTVAQLIGSIDAKGYGRLSSDVVTQFMPASTLDTRDVTAADIDSLKLIMQVGLGSYIGDSIAPLGIQIYPLTRELPSPIYSNFDPTGYYDPNNLLGSTIYNVSATTSNPLETSFTYRSINVNLPLDLGRKLFQAYLDNAENFATPALFVKNVFPGIYIKNSYGSGRVTSIGASMMRLYYHRTYYDESAKKDSTVYKVGNYFAVTPEIVTNNNISLTIAPEITTKVNQGQAIVLAPAGLNVEIQFPILDIINSYNSNTGTAKVINTLTMSIPAETITNDYGIAPPKSLLLVLTKDREEFFLNNKLPDSKTSFFAEYNATTRSYNFTELRQYLIDMIAKGNNITPQDYTFTLMPITATYESTGTGSYYAPPSSVLSTINPYVGTPTMGRLLVEKAKIKLTYSKQTITF